METFARSTSRLVIIIFILSCNNGKDDNLRGKNNPVTADSVRNGAVTAHTIADGYMDTLYIGKQKFLQLSDNRMALKYFINSASELTLSGWQTSNDIDREVYQQGVKLELKTGNPSPQNPYGAGNYLGGVVLHKRDIESIKGLLNDASITTVIFAPEKDKDGTGNYTGHFKYNIYISDYVPLIQATHVSPKVLKSVNVTANPSPPRNS